MDLTPPPPYHRSTPNSQPKSASLLARIENSVVESEKPPPVLSLDLTPSSPKITPDPTSPIYPKSSTSSLTLHELLLLSPSPVPKSRTRLAERLDMAEEAAEPTGRRRRCKSKGTQLAVLGCNSPRNNRRSRRRVEMEVRDDKDPGPVEDLGKPRKRRNSGKSKKEKLSLAPAIPSSSTSPNVDDYDRSNLDRMGEIISDLVMWRDMAKSSLWFGLGCLCILSSCFSKGVCFSLFPASSQLGLLILGASFLSSSIGRRENLSKKRDWRLRDEDLMRLGRLILPAVNLAISKAQELFSGEPSMTLKVAPFLLLGAEYGYLVTLWRLCAFGFFISFTVPKLYTSYSSQINQKGDYMKQSLVEAWRACSHKKLVAGSAITAFWNLSSIKTRIFTAFIALVIIRYCQQHFTPNSGEPNREEEKQQEPDQPPLVVAEEQSQK